jgi:hypothetical protein
MDPQIIALYIAVVVEDVSLTNSVLPICQPTMIGDLQDLHMFRGSNHTY